ncbi:glycosyltransferase [Desulfoplanes formicivorans]|uniref:Beta-1,4-galactosyltransferase n=1 Tax=Desulfoplanes formicivorans TaxID=1592317 RepID=A0A194AJ82_9BACT|nr:glycosyltransferase [Desulfoplanes formicivorans]GAU09121.1 beta-1,4-galactosyltransferase [Desulfoplanes formicivorans]
MITVLLGTNPYSFERLIRQVDQIASNHSMQFYVQLGNTQLVPRFCEYDRFVERKILLQKIMESDVIVSHGGFGSIHDALVCKKPVVAVPRQPRFGESQDIQEELVRELEKDKKIIAVYDINQLYEKIQNAYAKHIDYDSRNSICNIINDFLKKML